MDIDYVFPYVDCNIKQWQELYRKTFNHKPSAQRYRDNGTLKYVFRCIEQNASWIRKVFFLVQDESQVPSWVNTESVEVITHDKFIPSKYLPCFNSNTIETFLGNIPGLSEYFLYGNDDMFLNSLSEPTDWFKNGKPALNMSLKKIDGSKWKNICKRSFEAVSDKPDDYFMVPWHFINPILKSTCLKLNSKLLKFITTERDFSKNVCQYVYPNYSFLNGEFEASALSYTYFSTSSNVNSIVKAIKNNENICINDSLPFLPSAFEKVLEALNYKYPTKSKYELDTIGSD